MFHRTAYPRIVGGDVILMTLCALCLSSTTTMANSYQMPQPRDHVLFYSEHELDVWIVGPDKTRMAIGDMPSAEPIRIPKGIQWGVTPRRNTTLSEILEVVREHGVPGLRLARSGLSTEDIRQLRTTPGLSILDLSHSPLPRGAVLDLHWLGHVERLYLSLTQLTDDDMLLLGAISFTGLKHLDVSMNDVSNRGVRALGGHTMLRSLDMSFTAVDDGAMSTVAQWPKLEVLNLGYTQITDNGMLLLGRNGSAELADLNLESTEITDEGIEHLAEFEALRRVNLKDTDITEQAGPHFEDMTELEMLDLRNTKVGDETLRALAGLEHLEKLRLAGTHVTDEGVSALKETGSLGTARK